ncbi:hypothetical protein WN55_04949 [Dufourea novaeangliae]|uniref:Uncharacterized protein n=1 Tax=Dufourea novaeangliae TaxID=178035 RepID=A0A154PMH3_DUFNO|nr:hypothetical protein WN55_04949 [Dufourea novaeangliae]
MSSRDREDWEKMRMRVRITVLAGGIRRSFRMEADYQVARMDARPDGHEGGEMLPPPNGTEWNTIGQVAEHAMGHDFGTALPWVIRPTSVLLLQKDKLPPLVVGYGLLADVPFDDGDGGGVKFNLCRGWIGSLVIGWCDWVAGDYVSRNSSQDASKRMLPPIHRVIH